LEKKIVSNISAFYAFKECLTILETGIPFNKDVQSLNSQLHEVFNDFKKDKPSANWVADNGNKPETSQGL